MRLLTPAEQREIEQVRNHIFKGTSFILRTYQWDEMTHGIDSDDEPSNKELWLNVLDLALQQNESLRREWVKI